MTKCDLDIRIRSPSRIVTLYDAEWLALPASQEVPRSCAECLQLQSDSLAGLQQCNHAWTEGRVKYEAHTVVDEHACEFSSSNDDHEKRDDSAECVSDAFQRLMKKSKTKIVTKETRSAYLVHECFA